MFDFALPENLLDFLRVWARPTNALLFVLVAWKWGDWRNWAKYYSTILYVIVFDLVYFGLTMGFPLWRYHHPVLGYTYSDFLIAFIMFPATMLLYLPYQPKEKYKQAGFLLLWVFIYASIELAQSKMGGIVYYNGWQFVHSVLFDCLFFIMARLHFKYPLSTFAVSLIMVPAVLALFNFPFTSVI